MLPETPPPSRLVTFRNAFFTGALLLAPMVVTCLAFLWVIDAVGGAFRPVYAPYLPQRLLGFPYIWELLATALVVLLVTAFGYLSRYVFGKMFLSMAESTVQRIPGIGAVYNSVKQIVATFGTQKRNVFSKVVMLEFPRKGVWVIGFLTNKDQAEAQMRTGVESWTVFVPTTPNPTSGFLVLVPRDDVMELEMSVGDGMKMIISGGAVLPPVPSQKPAEALKTSGS